MSLTGLAFLLVFAFGVALTLFRHPIWGLYSYMALVYIHPPSRWWGQDLPDLRWSLIVACVTMFAALTRKDISASGFLKSPLVRCWIIFVCWVWITSIWAVSWNQQLEGAILFTKYLVMWLLIYCLVQDEETLKRILSVHVAGCFFLGYLAWEASGSSGRLEGVGGPGLDEANVMAMHVATGAAVACMLILIYRDWARYLAILAAPFLLNTIILSGSRGAFLALGATGLAMYTYKPKKFRIAFIFAGIVGIGALLYLADTKFIDRILTISNVSKGQEAMDTSAASRFVLIEAQWEMAKDHPFGSGHRGTGLRSRAYMEERWMANDGARGSHNTIMTVLVDQGFPGLVIFLLMLTQLAVSFLSIRKWAIRKNNIEMHSLATGIFGAVAMVLGAGLFVNYQKAEVFYWMMALLTAFQNIIDKKEAKVDEQQDKTLPQTYLSARPSLNGLHG